MLAPGSKMPCSRASYLEALTCVMLSEAAADFLQPKPLTPDEAARNRLFLDPVSDLSQVLRIIGSRGYP